MNEVNVNVNAINNIPATPALSSFCKLNCLNDDGAWISYIPNRLNAKKTKSNAMKRFIYGLDAIWFAPEAPREIAKIKPKDVKIVMIPNV